MHMKKVFLRLLGLTKLLRTESNDQNTQRSSPSNNHQYAQVLLKLGFPHSSVGEMKRELNLSHCIVNQLD